MMFERFYEMLSIKRSKVLRTIALLTALLEVLVCVACVPENGGTSAVHTETPDATCTTDARPLKYEEVFEPSTDFDNRFGRGFADIMETEDAYYLGLGKECYLYYYDKQTKEYGVLCGKPDCIHDADPSGSNTECGGFVGCVGENNISIMGSLPILQQQNSHQSQFRHGFVELSPILSKV